MSGIINFAKDEWLMNNATVFSVFGMLADLLGDGPEADKLREQIYANVGWLDLSDPTMVKVVDAIADELHAYIAQNTEGDRQTALLERTKSLIEMARSQRAIGNSDTAFGGNP